MNTKVKLQDGNKRLRRVINYLISEEKVKNVAEFADTIEQNRSGVSEKLSGRRSLTDAFALKVTRAFPEINADYLLRQECEQMLNGSHKEALYNGAKTETLDEKLDRLIKIGEEIRKIVKPMTDW